MYDVIVVGARCAGAALAFRLARSGLDVLMLDRAAFPSDTMSGHYIHPAGVSSLKRLGVLDRLAATDTPPQSVMTFDAGPVVLTGAPTPGPDGNAVGYGPRRWLFDAMLAERATEAAARFWEGVSIKGPIVEDGRVVGVEGVTRRGQPVEARARLVVGADGKRSRLAEHVGARKYNRRAAATCVYYAYWEGMDVAHTRLFVREGRFCVALPTNQGLTSVACMWPAAALHEIRTDIERAFAAAVSEIPWLGDRIAAGRRVERFLGTADTEGFFREAHGPGWALVGDAGLHVDPITAQGMTNALLHAEILADAIVEGFSGGAEMSEALAGYQRRRDAMAAPMFDLTHDLARLAPPPPEMAALLEALQDDPAGTSRFLGVMAGTVAVEEVFGAKPSARAA